MLQEALDSARALTEASFGAIILLDESGQIEDLLSSGLDAEEAGLMWDMPDAMRFFNYLGGMGAPLQVPDLLGHIRG